MYYMRISVMYQCIDYVTKYNLTLIYIALPFRIHSR